MTSYLHDSVMLRENSASTGTLNPQLVKRVAIKNTVAAD